MPRIKVQKCINPKAPSTLQLQKACPWEHKTATTWLLSHLSAWHQPHPCEAFNPTPSVKVTLRVRVMPGVTVTPRFRVQKTTEPKGPETVMFHFEF